MAELETIRNSQLHIVVERAKTIDTERITEEVPKEQIPFFGSRRKKEPWVVTLLLMVYLFVFFVTMFLNDCPRNSHGDCAAKFLGRLSFQPLKENPLLGPSPSTLNKIGALRRTSVTQHLQQWRLVTNLLLHAGLIHFVVNLVCFILIGIRLEQDFGALRIGMICVLSAFTGSLISAIFVENSPAVGSSGALFGLLGTMLCALVQNWGVYANKFAAFVVLFLVATINLILGLLPHVDNFLNIGAFLSGILLSCALLFNLEMVCSEPREGIFEFGYRSSTTLRRKMDKPAFRIISILLFVLILVVLLVAAICGVNGNKYCSWCHYINCVPTKMWSCSEKAMPCEVKISRERLTLTCEANGNFQMYPFADISQARINDLCSMICS